LELVYDGPLHGRPEAKDFSKSIKARDRSADLATGAQHLVEQLAEFRIIGEIKTVTQGPVVTTYEFKPSPGTKVSKIAALGEDLARLLKAQSLRVLAPIPGKDTVGFEVPNTERAVIGFADLIAAPAFSDAKKRLPIAMGVDIFGAPVIEDLAEMPHLLVAGSTGSGKSVFMNSLIASLIARHTADTLRLVMIDPKMVELAAYNGLPHMAYPVITDPQLEAKSALAHLVQEMDQRYQRMKALGARNIDAFNVTIKTSKKHQFVDFDGPWAPMPYIVLIIDEMADMMMQLGREAELPIARLAQKARAAGIHMVIATQRPTADVVTGLIKANFPTRVAFRVLSGLDSRTILDQVGAESLLGKGDMLYLASGGARRLHGAYLSDVEVQGMVRISRKKKS
jgi:S-DNA-T family DNA segregation ATPase FtsK/SpoIIIE